MSIVIPAFNEAERIGATLSSILPFMRERYSGAFEVIIVDDGSEDDTSDLVKRERDSYPEIGLVQLAKNYGKGAAVCVGLQVSRAELVLMADADGSTPIQEVERLEAALREESADIAIGSRALESEQTSIRARWHRRLLGRLFNTAVNLLLIPKIRDTQCGFKLYRSRAKAALSSRQTLSGYAFDLEHLYLAHLLGFKVVEVPVNWAHVSGSKVNVALDGLKMLVSIAVIRLRHRRG